MAIHLHEEGPLFYTRSLLEVMRELSSDPVERASLDRAVLLLEKGKVAGYRATPGSVGLVNTKEDAVRALVGYMASRMSWTDVQTKLQGRAAYARKVRYVLALLSTRIGYRGKWDALADSLVRKATEYWNW